MKFRGLYLFLQNEFQILQNLGVATNQKVAGSNPSSRTKTKGNCFRSCLLFWVPAAGGGLHPSILECSGRQSRPSAKVFACGKNACTAHSRRGPEGLPGTSSLAVLDLKHELQPPHPHILGNSANFFSSPSVYSTGHRRKDRCKWRKSARRCSPTISPESRPGFTGWLTAT